MMSGCPHEVTMIVRSLLTHLAKTAHAMCFTNEEYLACSTWHNECKTCAWQSCRSDDTGPDLSLQSQQTAHQPKVAMPAPMSRKSTRTADRTVTRDLLNPCPNLQREARVSKLRFIATLCKPGMMCWRGCGLPVCRKRQRGKGQQSLAAPWLLSDAYAATSRHQTNAVCKRIQRHVVPHAVSPKSLCTRRLQVRRRRYPSIPSQVCDDCRSLSAQHSNNRV